MVQLAAPLVCQHSVLSVQLLYLRRASSPDVEIECLVELLARVALWRTIVDVRRTTVTTPSRQGEAVQSLAVAYSSKVHCRSGGSEDMDSCISRSSVARSTVALAVG